MPIARRGGKGQASSSLLPQWLARFRPLILMATDEEDEGTLTKDWALEGACPILPSTYSSCMLKGTMVTMLPIPGSLPFDNLYKFAAMLLVSLAISSFLGGVWANNLHNAGLKENVREMVALLNKPNMSEHDKGLVTLLSNLSTQSLKDTKAIVIVLFTIGFGSLIGAAAFLSAWHRKEQCHKDELLVLQVKAMKFDYEQNIRRLIDEA